MRYAKYLIVLSIVLIGLLAVTPRQVFACTCIYPPDSPQAALARVTAVFAGKVVRIEHEENRSPHDPDLKVTFQVVSVWKGQLSPKLVVYTMSSGTACGYTFFVDKEYLVYAYSHDSYLQTNICGRTQPFVPDSEDLKALGVGQIPAAPISLTAASPTTNLLLPALAALVIIGLILGRTIISRKRNG